MTSNSEDIETESVHVVVRVRPLNSKEEMQNCQNIISINHEENIIALENPKLPNMQCKSFKFDHVFFCDCTQLDIYQKVALPIVDQVFKGYNGTIFAYGQTGSGKTYTMSGNQTDNELKGIIPNTFSHIFSQISRASNEKSFVVTVTYVEIYNEEVRDLLSVHPNEKLEIRERVDVGVYVRGLTGFTVDSINAINELLQLGNSTRKTRATLMNNLSSRSHTIFTITIETKDREHNKTTVAKLNLVDLAGSERLKRTEATGIGLKEASNINQSLFVLSNVISALVEEKCTHVPYRNSKLTRLLQDSLGGNSKTAIITTISPNENDYDESLCTLRYASRAKLIKNHVRLNIQTNKGLIENFEQEILELQKRLEQISMNEEIKRQKTRKGKSQSKEILKRYTEQTKEFKNIENVKSELNRKIQSIQNKILVGGKNLFDKAQEQVFLLESSFEEIKNLDKSHQELQELLEEKEIEHFDLQEQYSSLQEEDKILDEKIERIQRLLERVKERHDEQRQEHRQELNRLFEHHQTTSRELQLTNELTKCAIPKNNIKIIESNVAWNSEICDFQVNGIAHVGNNMKKPKRRFKKHIPKSALMGILFNERKNVMRANKVIFKKCAVKNSYQQYVSQKKDEESKDLEEIEDSDDTYP
ncbi:hypothetical protein ILUMI_24889 [Ignelater luminosus]|uniref:Kinesin-like protein n=1 Tax=Ignelater luminosus TaxID=2038154 RepID=A0A8K0C6D0_IGNLU|nr:hypothetical protein ILUMI_24889 [Ignelater luminosus]